MKVILPQQNITYYHKKSSLEMGALFPFRRHITPFKHLHHGTKAIAIHSRMTLWCGRCGTLSQATRNRWDGVYRSAYVPSSPKGEFWANITPELYCLVLYTLLPLVKPSLTPTHLIFKSCVLVQSPCVLSYLPISI